MSKVDDELKNGFDEELDEELGDALNGELGEDFDEDYDEDFGEDSVENFEDEFIDDSGEGYVEEDEVVSGAGSHKRSDRELNRKDDAEYYDYYGIEQEKKRPARKIAVKDQEKTRSLRMKRYKEQSLARYSNIYMIAGVFIGVAIFFFLVSPELKSNYNEKLREMKTSYNKTLSTKNSEIDNLKMQMEGLTVKNEEYENTQAAMQTTIDNLTSEVEMLKQNIENGGLMVASSPDAYIATTTDASSLPQGVAVKNAAAERNNANVIGISRTAIEDMIKNE